MKVQFRQQPRTFPSQPETAADITRTWLERRPTTSKVQHECARTQAQHEMEASGSCPVCWNTCQLARHPGEWAHNAVREAKLVIGHEKDQFCRLIADPQPQASEDGFRATGIDSVVAPRRVDR